MANVCVVDLLFTKKTVIGDRLEGRRIREGCRKAMVLLVILVGRRSTSPKTEQKHRRIKPFCGKKPSRAILISKRRRTVRNETFIMRDYNRKFSTAATNCRF